MGVHTPPPAPPLAGSLLPVVMVIRGFGQDYEIFYLATSALMQRTSKPAPPPPPSLLRLPPAPRTAAIKFVCFFYNQQQFAVKQVAQDLYVR